MLDRRLYRDVSDLLELNVADDKIVRILLVRGFTTEQVKRAIKEIRSKAEPRPEPPKKQAPVSETIETGPSKRFGFMSKLFGKKLSDEEIIADEAGKLAIEERKLKTEEAQIHAEVQRLVEKAQKLGGEPVRLMSVTTVPDDVKEILRMVDGLLDKLPEEEIQRFARSPQFEKYKAVMKKYVG